MFFIFLLWLLYQEPIEMPEIRPPPSIPVILLLQGKLMRQL
jgi:hypothetical protein